jgi:hypothetical protein
MVPSLMASSSPELHIIPKLVMCRRGPERRPPAPFQATDVEAPDCNPRQRGSIAWYRSFRHAAGQHAGPRTIVAANAAHHNGRRPHRGTSLPHHPPGPPSTPTTDESLTAEPVLGGLISEYQRAA